MSNETSTFTEDEVRRRAEANGLVIEERFVPGIAKGIERVQVTLARIDPARLRDIEPAVTFRAKR
jgi:hypothetical protein